MDVIVRSSSEPLAMAAAIRSKIQTIDRSVAKFRIATVEQELDQQTGERRFDTFLLGSFAFAALFLSAIGIYGLLHHLVVQRTNEIGVRMALGARPGTVMALVLRQGLALALIGTAAGVLGALTISRVLSKLLYGVTPTDPITFASSAFLLLAVAGMACWVPSRRAARVDPMLALRHD
jgi:ABC-type antimicrobial peptide transport system permease subunit